ncbi:MAG TPA: DNA-binding protein [Candidatus Obscuribacter sp.]|nr:DNA-binding protein [Candidatus Obscuribacter sp.]HNM49597.1 DNA-binding protein [Candidatus Obscuribacter sp.]HNN61412.1 DNA-binding protein [Candidatus Obscuribacter sp.]
MARVQRQAIDQDEFNETADRLRAEGKKVSAVTMRQALGGGSYDTIYKYLGMWEARTPSALIKVEPQVIPASVQAGFANAWRLAREEAAAEIQSIKDKCAEEVDAVLAQFHGALEAIAQIESERKAEVKELEELTVRLAQLQSEVSAAKEAGAGYKATAEQLRAQVSRLEKDLEHERKQAKEAAERHYEEKAELTSKVELWTEQARLSRECSEKLDSDCRTQREKIRGLVSEREQDQSENKAKTAERDAAMKEAAQLKGKVEGLEQQVEQLLERLTKPGKTK